MSTINTERSLPFWHRWPLESLPKRSLKRTAQIALSASQADVAGIHLLEDNEPWQTTGINTDQLPSSFTSALCSHVTKAQETTLFTQSDLVEQWATVPTLDRGERVGYVVGTPLRVEGQPPGTASSTVGLLFVVGTASSPPADQITACIDQLGRLLEDQIEGWITRHGTTQLFEDLSEALITLNSQSRITFINDQAQTLLECPRTTLLGKEIWTAFPEVIGTEAEERCRYALEHQESVSFQTYHPRLQTWFQVKTSPFHGGLLLNLDDVTAQVEQQEALAIAQKEAQQANRLKSTFLANMSHEIRTPLTSIIGFAETLHDQIATLETAPNTTDLSSLRQFTTLIEKGGRRLLNTLNALLNLSKLEAGEMGVSLQPLDLTMEVREMVKRYESQAKAADIDLQTDLPDPPVRGRVDRQGIRIILRNLLSNAVKYTKKGGWVRIHLREQNETVTLEVEDCGIGMDPERVPELFEAFKQESTGTSRAYEGAGLGLTVIKRLAELMDLSIEVDTEKGKGSTFALQIPGAPETVES